jgi:hypothetical protein
MVQVKGAGNSQVNGFYHKSEHVNEWEGTNGAKIEFYWPKDEEDADFHLRGWGISQGGRRQYHDGSHIDSPEFLVTSGWVAHGKTPVPLLSCMVKTPLAHPCIPGKVWNSDTEKCVCAMDTILDATLNKCVLAEACSVLHVEGAGYFQVNGFYQKT